MSSLKKSRSRRMRKKLFVGEFLSYPDLAKHAIARRDFEFTFADGRVIDVQVWVWQPTELGPHNWRCSFLIQTAHFQKLSYGDGDDSMQALLLATHKISSHLSALENEFDGRFSQYGAHHGFPALTVDTFPSS
ncbi:DUF6968 family protein [Undibacterium sp. Di27W]|uniref:DUF6968 family protein n=1 Tax=Undibacterium sp. Di27W TaxID=3413036 RepID=UPI003BF37A9F